MKKYCLHVVILLIYSSGFSQNQNVGIGNSNPQFPLSFNGNLGDKISLWTDGSPSHYGFGIQPATFQMFSKTNLDDIAIGYGSSTSFNERMRILNSGGSGMKLNGRLELKNGTIPLNLDYGPGIWLYKADNSGLLGFMGTQDNQNIGFYGGPAGWGLTYDAINSRVGIGTTTPLTQLHIRNGSSGATPFGFSLLAVESNGHTYINLLSPIASESAILFGQPGSAANGVIMYNNADTPNGFQFRTNNNFTRMIINNAGNVGIGTVTPYATLHVRSSPPSGQGLLAECISNPGSGTGVLGSGGQTGVAGYANMPGIGNRFGLVGNGEDGDDFNYGVYAGATGGSIAIGVLGYASGGTEENWAGYFLGDVFSAGTYEGSDRKLKNDIKSLDGALSIINQLNPSVYTFKTNEYKQMHLPDGLHYGLIADEVQLVVPGAVKKAVQPAQYENHDEREGKILSDEVEFYAVNYTEMIPILIAAVKEQQVMIGALKIKNQKIDQQQQQIEQQQLAIDELKMLVLSLGTKE